MKDVKRLNKYWKDISASVLIALGGLGATAIAPRMASAHTNTEPTTKRVVKHRRARFGNTAMRRRHRKATRVKRIKQLKNHVYTAKGLTRMRHVSNKSANKQHKRMNNNQKQFTTNSANSNHINVSQKNDKAQKQNKTPKRNSIKVSKKISRSARILNSRKNDPLYINTYHGMVSSLHQSYKMPWQKAKKEALTLWNTYDLSLNKQNLIGKRYVIRHESGGHWKILSYGGRCIGRFQLDPDYLGRVHGHINLRPANQERASQHYVRGRYGNWVNAKRFWQSHNWY